MSDLLSFAAIGLSAALVIWIEVPSMLRAGQTRELWAFAVVGVIALTLLTLVSASVTFSSINDALVDKIMPYVDPIIKPPTQ